MRYWAVAKRGDQNKNGYITHAFSRAHNWAELLCHLYNTPAFSGDKNGRNCYITPGFSGSPRRGDKIKKGYITRAFLWDNKWAELLHHPCLLGGP